MRPFLGHRVTAVPASGEGKVREPCLAGTLFVGSSSQKCCHLCVVLVCPAVALSTFGIIGTTSFCLWAAIPTVFAGVVLSLCKIRQFNADLFDVVHSSGREVDY